MHQIFPGGHQVPSLAHTVEYSVCVENLQTSSFPWSHHGSTSMFPPALYLGETPPWDGQLGEGFPLTLSTQPIVLGSSEQPDVELLVATAAGDL